MEEPVTELDELLHAILLLTNEFKNRKPKKKNAAVDSSNQKGFKKREEATENLKYSLNVDEENLSFGKAYLINNYRYVDRCVKICIKSLLGRYSIQ